MKPNRKTLLMLTTAATLGCTPNIDLGALPGDTEGDTESVDGTGQTEGGSTTEGTATSGDSSGTAGMRPEGDVEGLDVLFVVDNSRSMGGAQGRLQEGATAIVAALDATGLDYRVGATTTDNGNYWCKGAGIGEAHEGHLIPPTSCRNRLDDFYLAAPNTNVFAEACDDRCDLDEISLVPGAGPWLSPNTLAGTSMAEALACSLPMGVNGCGFEQPLEAMRLATTWSESSDVAESGFIRPNAHLVVIFVTDEADCSFNPIHETTAVGELGVGNQVFWSLPEEQQSPTSAVCWNAAVECTGSGTPAYDACVARDKAVDGSNATNAAEAVIHPLARYTARLDAVRASKVAGAGVYTFGITGVPEAYAGPGDVLYATGADGSNPESFQASFGVGPGCIQGDLEAVPPVRMLEFTQAGDQSGVPLFSICSNSYADFFGQMFAQVGD